MSNEMYFIFFLGVLRFLEKIALRNVQLFASVGATLSGQFMVAMEN